MRGNLRLALICVSSLLLFSLYLLQAHLQDLSNQYRAGAYVVEWLDRNGASTPVPAPTQGDKVIVMAKLEEENTEWVAEELPEYVPTLHTHTHHQSQSYYSIPIQSKLTNPAGNAQSTPSIHPPQHAPTHPP